MYKPSPIIEISTTVPVICDGTEEPIETDHRTLLPCALLCWLRCVNDSLSPCSYLVAARRGKVLDLRHQQVPRCMYMHWAGGVKIVTRKENMVSSVKG